MHKHRIRVEGYEGSLQKLAQQVCILRYDKVALFFGYCAVELIRQANADMLAGRKLLAIKLTSAAGIASALQKATEGIVRLCAPHMPKELTPRVLRKWQEESGNTYWWRGRN